MNYKFTVTLLYLIISNGLYAQNPYHKWSSNMLTGTSTSFERTHVRTTASGEVYYAGFGYGDLDPDPNVIDNPTYTEGYIQKLDSSMNLIWAHAFGDTDFINRIDILGMDLDTAENVLLFGRYRGQIDFDPGTPVFNLPFTGAQFNGFIMKLDSSGSFMWAKSLDSDYECWVESIDVNGSNEIGMVGKFKDGVDLDPGTGVTMKNSSNSGIYDVFISKLDEDANLIWYRVVENDLDVECRVVTFDLLGDIYCGVRYKGTIDLDTGPGVNLVLNPYSYENSVLIKFDASGNQMNEHIIGSENRDRIRTIKITNSNEVLIGGKFGGQVDFDPGSGISNLDGNEGNSFFYKLDPNFNLLWAKSFGTNTTSSSVASMAIDPIGNIFTGGYFFDSTDHDPSLSIQYETGFGGVACFGKYTTNGDFIWAKSVDGGNGGESVHEIALDDYQNLYLSGRYYESISSSYQKTDFDPSPQVYHLPSVSPAYKEFKSRFKLCTSSQNPIPDVINLPDVVSICQIDSLTVPHAQHDCAGDMHGIPDVSFPLYFIGDTIVNWTYDDGYGNVTVQSQNVQITGDFESPVPDIAILPNLESECEIEPEIPFAVDNCVDTVYATTTTLFPINIVGDSTILWSYDDGHGNISTQTQLLTVIQDTTPPVPYYSSLADVPSYCSYAGPFLAPDAYDQCSGQFHFGVPSPPFPITVVGTTVVTWTYTDNYGNQSFQNQSIIITDPIPPVFDTVSYQIMANCFVDTIVPPSASDVCDTMVEVTTNQTFPITTFGTTMVLFTATDDNGNSTPFLVEVIINDTIAPIIDSLTVIDQSVFCSYDTISAPTSLDDCSGTISGVPDVLFPINSVGMHTVNWTFTDSSGNSSEMSQEIEILGLDNTINTNGSILQAEQNGVSYQWIDCKLPISEVVGETGQNFIPTQNGDYAVIVSSGSCVDTSDCVLVEGLGLNEIDAMVKVYPNPTDGVFTIEVSNFEFLVGEILDLKGNLIQRFNLNSEKMHLSLIDEKRGVYILRIILEDSIIVNRIILQ